MSDYFVIAAKINKATMADAYWHPACDSPRSIKSRTPSQRTWLAAARAEAQDSRVSLRAIITGSMTPMVAQARWRAWKRVLDADPRYSVNALAKTSGFDHTTILYAMRRLAGCPPSKRAKAQLMSGKAR